MMDRIYGENDSRDKNSIFSIATFFGHQRVKMWWSLWIYDWLLYDWLLLLVFKVINVNGTIINNFIKMYDHNTF